MVEEIEKTIKNIINVKVVDFFMKARKSLRNVKLGVMSIIVAV